MYFSVDTLNHIAEDVDVSNVDFRSETVKGADREVLKGAMSIFLVSYCAFNQWQRTIRLSFKADNRFGLASLSENG